MRLRLEANPCTAAGAVRIRVRGTAATLGSGDVLEIDLDPAELSFTTRADLIAKSETPSQDPGRQL
jgi:hypothetical protein